MERGRRKHSDDRVWDASGNGWIRRKVKEPDDVAIWWGDSRARRNGVNNSDPDKPALGATVSPLSPFRHRRVCSSLSIITRCNTPFAFSRRRTPLSFYWKGFNFVSSQDIKFNATRFSPDTEAELPGTSWNVQSRLNRGMTHQTSHVLDDSYRYMGKEGCDAEGNLEKWKILYDNASTVQLNVE
jgi:hypothetical protein